MRIVHVTNAWPVSSYPAFGIHVKRQYESLNTPNKDLVFINAREKGWFAYLYASYYLHVCIGNLEDKRIVLHVHNHLTFLSIFPYLLLRGWFDRTVVSIMGDAKTRGMLYSLLVRLTQKFAFKVIDKTGELEGAVFLPNGVDMNFWSSEHKIQRPIEFSQTRRNIIMVTANKNSKNKRVDMFYDIAKSLRGEAYHFILVCGKTPTELRNYYASADLLILLSDSEGSPNCVKEMLAMNGNVLSRDVGDLQMYKDFSNVTIADYRSSIADYCNLILSMNFDLTVNSRLQLIHKGYSNEDTAKALMDIYKSCR